MTTWYKVKSFSWCSGTFAAWALLVSVCVTACAPGSMKSANEVRAIRMQRYLAGLPVWIEYADSPLSFVVGESVTPIVPEMGGVEKFDSIGFEISGALPLGLSFDPASGVITGVPLEPASQQSFVVGFLGNGARVTDTELTLTVTDLVPEVFQYAAGVSWSLDRLAAFSSGAPQFQTGGGAPVSFSVTPALPAGLALSTSTGVITGAPTTAMGASAYTLTAHNSGGSRDRVVTLAILEPLPTKPTSLAATPGLAQISLSWQAPTPLTGSQEVLSYRLERRLTPGVGAWSLVVDSHPTLSYTDTGRDNGESVEYRVLARHSRGLGEASSTVVASAEALPVPLASAVAILVERGLAVSPPLAITAQAPEGPIQQCSVTPALPAGLGVSFDSSIQGCWVSGIATEARALAQYTLTAQNHAGSGQVNFSVEVSDPIPGAPLQAQALVLSPSSIKLRWVDPSTYETGFSIERRILGETGFTHFTQVAAVPAAEGSGSTLEWDDDDTDLKPEVQVEYRIYTLAVGVNSVEVELAVTPMDFPAAPVITASQSLVGGVRIQWSAVAGPGQIQYQVFKDGQLQASMPAGVLEHIELNLEAGVPYVYTVKAVNAAGSSAASNQARMIPYMAITNNFSLIAVGGHHSCRVRTDPSGKVECWGSNSHGQLGDGSTTDSGTPVEVLGLEDVVSITAGDLHTCAILADTTLRCWGDQSKGKLGNGQSAAGSVTTPASVLGVTGPVLLGNVRDVSAGAQHTCATLYAGAVYCWGSNLSGQLGVGQAPASLLESARPILLPTLGGVIHAKAGFNHSCALLATTEVACWGANQNGGLGDGSSLMRTSPVYVRAQSGSVDIAVGFREVSVGNLYSCARYLDHTVKCWGRNLQKQLGDGSTTNRYYPTTVSGLTGVRQVQSGYSSSCVIREDAGVMPSVERVTCWGANASGELGNGTQLSSSVPVDSNLSAWNVPGTGDPVPELAMSASSQHVYVLEGSGWLWGLNDEEQVQAGGSDYETEPVN